MIKVRTELGEYTVENGELITNIKAISVIYEDFVKRDCTVPSEGPHDYAVGKKLADAIGEGFEIIEQNNKYEDLIY